MPNGAIYWFTLCQYLAPFLIFMLDIAKFDEIHKSTQKIYEETKDLEIEPRKKKVEKYLSDILIDCFILGLTINDLPYLMPLDIEKMNDVIYQEIAGKTFKDRVDLYIEEDEYEDLLMLMESEAHRVHENSQFLVAQYNQEKGLGVMKTWHTMGDDRVRDTHDYLTGWTIPIDERFITYDLDTALFPSGFSKAENNVNCRCWLSYQVSK